jgi:uncharacterized membrane protein
VSNAEQSYENVIVVSFEDDSHAYEALTRLKELDSQGQIGLQAAAVVVRDQDGTVESKDEVGNEEWAGTAGGGLLGLLIGIIGGPLGVLIGGATGLLVGSLFDLDDADETDSVLSNISSSVRVGHTSLLAELAEQSYEVVDTAMAGLGGTVLRRSVADVEAEMAAAEKAQREAKRKARKELLEARHEKSQEKVHAKVAELKAKLHPHKDKVAADKAPAAAES